MKHRSIKESIRALILSGEGVSSEGRLCSERKLSAMFHVSRTTVRKAIDSLCRRGS